MYIYSVKLTLSNPKTSIDFSTKKDLLLSTFDAYNENSAFMANRKTLSNMKIAKNEIVIELTSQHRLTTVGRAMRSFTSLLIEQDDKDFSSAITASGALFTYTVLNEIAVDEQPQDQISKITDADLLKGLIDYVCSNRETSSSLYKKKRDCIQEMKRLAVASGIISISENNNCGKADDDNNKR